eukprot:COSAG02_NODE_49_length_45106_cov_298.436177_3_plen_89_part_00
MWRTTTNRLATVATTAITCHPQRVLPENCKGSHRTTHKMWSVSEGLDLGHHVSSHNSHNQLCRWLKQALGIYLLIPAHLNLQNDIWRQ